MGEPIARDSRVEFVTRPTRDECEAEPPRALSPAAALDLGC